MPEDIGYMNNDGEQKFVDSDSSLEEEPIDFEDTKNN